MKGSKSARLGLAPPLMVARFEREGVVICGRPLLRKGKIGLRDDPSGCGHLSGLLTRR